MNTIGVVIPCFNYARFLRDCLASVFAQNVPLSAVVVDDAGDDGAEIEALGNEFQTSVIHLPTQRGIGIARNTGAAYLNTDLILFLDADDTLHEGALGALRDTLAENPQAAFAYGNYSENGNMILTPVWDARLLHSQNIASYCNLWRRGEFWRLGGYRDIPVAEDWDLQKRAAVMGIQGAHSSAVIFEHVLHDANKWARDSIAYGGLERVAEYLANYG